MSIIRAIDCSSFSGLPKPADIDQLQDLGVKLAIVQAHGGLPGGKTGPNPLYNDQLAIFHGAGFDVATYHWPPAAATWVTAHPWSIFTALDVEARATIPQEAVLGSLARGEKALAYTGRGSWAGQAWGLALWDASYFEDLGLANWPTDLADRFVAYGPWGFRVGWQFKGTTRLAGGLSVDLSIFSEHYINLLKGR